MSIAVAALGIQLGLARYALSCSRVDASAPIKSSEAHALPQRFQLVSLQPGQVLRPRELGTLFPARVTRAGLLYTPGLPQISTKRRSLPVPGWLLYSNNPEVVSPQDLRCSDPAVLCREELPPGQGRLFASHINPTNDERALVVEFRNAADRPAALVVRRKGQSSSTTSVAAIFDAGLEVWRQCSDTQKAFNVKLSPGGSWQQRIEHVKGDAILMEDIQCNVPLRCTVAMSSRGAAERSLTSPVIDRRFKQSRGLFPSPDSVREADLKMTDGTVRVLALDGPWLEGLDHGQHPPHSDSLMGDYAAITHLKMHLTPGVFRRMVILMVPRGGEVGALLDKHPYRAEPCGALVLFNQVLEHPTTFSYDFSLPANSYAPVHFLFVPLRA